MPPYHGGGEMIEQVTFEKTTFAAPPARLKPARPTSPARSASVPRSITSPLSGSDAISAYENELLAYGTAALQAVEGLTLIGTAEHKAAVFSFTLDGIHPYDMSPVLDHEGIAIRTGHHCTQPVMDRFGLPATVRASLFVLQYQSRDRLPRLGTR